MTVRKRAVVTGAASGLGRDISIALGRRGFHVLISDLDMTEAAVTLTMVEQAGGTGETYRCDVTNVEEFQNMAEHVFDGKQGLDLLVNNAGVACGGVVGDAPIRDWQWVMGINFWGMVHGCHCFIPRMKRNRKGHIINVSSAAGLCSLPMMAAYNTSKAAVISLSETLKSELSPYRIGVTVVCPSFFNTNLLKDFRSCDEFEDKFAHAAFENARMTSEDIAEMTVRAYERNRLYVIPQRSARLYSFLKRMSPTMYFKASAFLNSTDSGKNLMYYAARLGLT